MICGHLPESLTHRYQEPFYMCFKSKQDVSMTTQASTTVCLHFTKYAVCVYAWIYSVSWDGKYEASRGAT